jgi:hypothetical protein
MAVQEIARVSNPAMFLVFQHTCTVYRVRECYVRKSEWILLRPNQLQKKKNAVNISRVVVVQYPAESTLFL